MLYLAIYATGESNMDASCHYFNVTAASTSPTSTSASSSSTPTSTKASTKTSSTSEPTKDPENGGGDSDDDDDGDSGLSTGAAAGIGVGATVGGLLVLGSLGFWLWKRHKRNSGAEYTPGQQQEAPVTEYYKPPEHQMSPQPMTPHAELPVQQQGYYNGQAYAQGPGGVHEAP